MFRATFRIIDQTQDVVFMKVSYLRPYPQQRREAMALSKYHCFFV